MYNSNKTIFSTLNSIKKQTVLPFEVIIIDDGSIDESTTIVENFIFNNPILNIQLVKKENGGVSTARNAGIKLAQGDWIALLDSDDEWLPNKLERQIQVLSENPTIDFLGTNRNGEFLKSLFFKKINGLLEISSRLLLVKYIFATPTVVFRKNIVDSVGFFDENQSHTEDNKFFITVCSKYNCFLLNESLVVTGGGKQHIGASGLSSNIAKMELGELKNLRHAYHMCIINFVEYAGLLLFSFLRFMRRLVLYKLIR